MNQKTKAFLGVIAIIGIFVLVSILVRKNHDFIYNLVGEGYKGIIIYILITILAIVIAPVSMMPLIPLASNMWGVFYASVFNIIGWTIGSFIVFFVCRKYGVPLVKKFISLEKINNMESRIPKQNVFFGVVLLRMLFPVDVLSYALSLFTKISFRTYAFATVLGLIPFAFVFSYLGTVPFYYQILGFLIMGLIIGLIIEFQKKKLS